MSALDIRWLPSTHEKYWYALEVLPPEFMQGGGFLVGEPCDHARCTVTGVCLARYEGNLEIGENYYVGSRPMTVPEFKQAIATTVKGLLEVLKA